MCFRILETPQSGCANLRPIGVVRRDDEATIILQTPTREKRLLELAIIPLLALHLLCVNVASAGPLVCIFLEWREGRGDKLAGQLANFLGQASFWTLLLGGLLGLAIGTLLWTDDYATLWTNAMAYKASWGLGEYFFSLLLAGGYLLWRCAPSRLRGLRHFLLFLNGSNLLYHFPFLFAVAEDVLRFGNPEEPIYGPGFRHWMAEPDVLARAVHVILASFAVTGVVLIGYGLRLQRQGSPVDAAQTARWGAWTALVPSLLQIPVGVWLVMVLPADWQARAMGGDVAAVVMLATSVLLALFMLQDLASIALGEVERKHMLRSMVLMVLIVLLMTGVLRRMRPDQARSSEPATASSLAASS
jgi:hypothetical protein